MAAARRWSPKIWEQKIDIQGLALALRDPTLTAEAVADGNIVLQDALRGESQQLPGVGIIHRFVFVAAFGIGRQYEGRPGLQKLKKCLRIAAAGRFYHDLDIMASFPTLVNFLTGGVLEPLRNYTSSPEARESVLNVVMTWYGCSRDNAKELFNRILFGGSVSIWKTDAAVVVNSQTSVAPTVVSDWIEACSKARDMVLEAHPDWTKAGRQFFSDRRDWKFSTFSYIIGELENRAVMSMVSAAEAHGWKVGSLQFDGMLVEKREGHPVSELLPFLVEAVRAECEGLEVVLVEKPMLNQPAHVPAQSAQIPEVQSPVSRSHTVIETRPEVQHALEALLQEDLGDYVSSFLESRKGPHGTTNHMFCNDGLRTHLCAHGCVHHGGHFTLQQRSGGEVLYICHCMSCVDKGPKHLSPIPVARLLRPEHRRAFDPVIARGLMEESAQQGAALKMELTRTRVVNYMNTYFVKVKGPKQVLIAEIRYKDEACSVAQQVELRSRGSFKALLENVRLPGKEWGKDSSLASVWLESRDCHEADKVDFAPGESSLLFREADTRQLVLNLYPGFLHQHDRSLEVDLDLIQPLLLHLSQIWCRGDDDALDYLLNWLAHMVQFPGRKVGTAVVVRSRQGGGKNIIIYCFF